MTNTQYGNYPTPSSRPPEPPYRADTQEGTQAPFTQQLPSQQQSVWPDEQAARFEQEAQPAQPVQQFGSNARSALESEPVHATQPAERYAQQTQPFAQAGEGSTDELPLTRGRQDFSGFDAPGSTLEMPVETRAQVASQPQTEMQQAAQPQAQQQVQETPASGYASTARPTAASETPASSPYNGRHSAQSEYSSTARASARGNAQAPSKKSGGGAKTFGFGFLGALVACAIAFGGFTAFNGWNAGNSGSSSSGRSSAVIGNTEQSVINAADEGQTLAEAVAAKALPSVVAVYNYQSASSSYGTGYGFGASLELSANTDGMQASGMGSGVLISEEGYILTNYHVIEDADALTVKVGDDERDATYVGGDSSSDVAVIKIDNVDGLTVADIGDSDSLVIGEWVMTIGAPLGLEQSVATGVVSATNRSTTMSDSDSSDLYSYYFGTTTPEYTYYPNMIQTDAVINPGNSGGALVDSDGKLIGINTMISSYSGDYAGVGFAIPINYAIGIAEQVIDGKEPTHAILGISISSVTASNAQRYGLSASKGAYIASIAEGTGAAESDLQVGDIITAIDGKEIESTTDVTLDVREHNVGDTVTVTVNRNGEVKDIQVTLSSDESVNNSGSGSGSGNAAPGNGSGSGNGSDSGNGRGSGSGRGSGNGYSIDELEDLLKMLGM